MEVVEVILKEISESAELVEEHEEENEEEHDPDGETAAGLGEDVVHLGHGLLEQRLGLLEVRFQVLPHFFLLFEVVADAYTSVTPHPPIEMCFSSCTFSLRLRTCSSRSARSHQPAYPP